MQGLTRPQGSLETHPKLRAPPTAQVFHLGFQKALVQPEKEGSVQGRERGCTPGSTPSAFPCAQKRGPCSLRSLTQVSTPSSPPCSTGRSLAQHPHHHPGPCPMPVFWGCESFREKEKRAGARRVCVTHTEPTAVPPPFPQAVLAGVTIFIHDKRGGTCWVSSEEWQQPEAVPSLPPHCPCLSPQSPWAGLQERPSYKVPLSPLHRRPC